jgi:RNA polymerase sigma factor (sigma-70 family)
LVYRGVDNELATDITQDLFMKLWEKKLQFREGRTKNLLYKMASDAFVSHFRKTQVAAKYEQSLELKVESNDPQKQLEYKEVQRQYLIALSTMGEKQREVFLMNRIEEMTYKEIAERLGLSVKAVEKRMSQAIGFFKERLIKK